MIKKDIILYGLVGSLVVAGFYFVGIEYAEEQQEELNESKQVALNWGNVTSTDTTCDEMRDKLVSLERETFDGRQLVMDAIYEKYQEFGC